MQRLKEAIFNLPELKQFDHLVNDKKRLQITGLTGSFRAFLLTYLLQRSERPVLYVAADLDSAEKLRDDIELISGPEALAFLPPLEFEPFDRSEPNPSVLRLRIESIQKMIERECWLAVTTPQGLVESWPRAEDFLDREVYLKKGMQVSFDRFIRQLADMGLSRVEIVENVGEFSVRGGIVDVYVYNYDDPIRLEFFGDEIESIRFFDVISQRSLRQTEEVLLLPNLEHDDHRVFMDAILPEQTLLFFENLALTEAYVEQVAQKAAQWSSTSAHEEETGFDSEERFKRRYLPPERLKAFLKTRSVFKTDFVRDSEVSEVHFSMHPHPQFHGRLKLFLKYLSEKHATGQDRDIVIQVSNQEQQDRLLDIFEEEHLEFSGRFLFGTLHNGFILPRVPLEILTDHEIFQRFKRKKGYKRFKSGAYLRQLSGLNLYDYVVHVDYGIGQYLGMETLNYGATKKECIKIGYQNGDHLYVTVDRLNRVQKYSSEAGAPPKLTKLGSGEWDRVKQKTKESVQKIAQELIQIYAARKAQGGHRFSPDNYLLKELEASFPFEETPDQIKSIADVKRDMESDQPMDRLLCGDVGFGKTEVALRAAFKAILDGKQVAMLVPTTILAFQHYETFRERFKEFPVRIEMLTRFRTPSQQKKILADLAEGQIDLVIGTHRLLSKDIRFKDLGLLIVDEEQRFGVRQKELLKKMRVSVDVLSMTATPIPRTLHIALMGARDLSYIDTPPSNRLPVHTEIIHWNERKLRNIILREMERGGQVYFVHNRVETIEGIQAALGQIVPEAKIAVGHGRLKETQLEKVMLDFMHGKYDVLLATMIIENGLDIPNVNTMIINRADRFGLAQLYQLRGRVGRSNQQAYAYLIVPPMHKISSLAQKRLRAILDFTDLGSGYKVALRDLELRGAGNLLGKEQSGFVQSVGFEMYTKILDEAVQEMRKGALSVAQRKQEEQPLRPTDPKLDVDFDLLIPAEYIPYELERITIYHRLVNFTSIEQTEALKEELKDRFGAFPPELELLLLAIDIKILAGRLLAERVIVNDQKIKLLFGEHAEKEEIFFNELIPAMLEQKTAPVQFLNQKKLGVEFKISGKDKMERMLFARNLLHNIVNKG